jgi:hypothetical protein
MRYVYILIAVVYDFYFVKMKEKSNPLFYTCGVLSLTFFLVFFSIFGLYAIFFEVKILEDMQMYIILAIGGIFMATYFFLIKPQKWKEENIYISQKLKLIVLFILLAVFLGSFSLAFLYSYMT